MKLSTILSENDFHCSDIIFFKNIHNDNCVRIQIDNGDWKHDHVRLEKFMKKKFKIKSYFQTVIEQDGSDVYSAYHTFIFKEVK